MEDLANPIAERYGRSPVQLRRKRVQAIVIGSVSAVLLLSFLVWVSVSSATKLDPKTTAYEVLGTGETTVTFTLLKPANSTVICALKALKQDYGTVGYKQVTLAGDKSLNATPVEVSQKVTLRTTEQAVTGLVDKCWFY
jgi:hypothetical protein